MATYVLCLNKFLHRNLPHTIFTKLAHYLRQLWRPRAMSVLMSDSFFWMS